LLYQLFAPGTALRYYRCRQGSIKDSEMWFTFTTNDLQVILVVFPNLSALIKQEQDMRSKNGSISSHFRRPEIFVFYCRVSLAKRTSNFLDKGIG